ncbi:MAG: cytochrome c3 family protein [Candidatus Zixiibacteriota bacterium]
MVKDFLKGTHARWGLSCADCHGGDPSAEDEDEAMDEDAGFIGSPAREDIPKFCARCHSDPNYMRGFNPNISTDQYSKYLISGHGMRLTKSADPKVAVCTSCHGVHGILPADNPVSPVFVTNIPSTCAACHADSAYMADRDIPTDQLHEYQSSVHGQALLEKGDRAAPACSGCHGSHEARIPDPSGVANTCAQCHNYVRELFVSSPHKEAHEKYDYPECEVCHGNHAIQAPTDAMLSQGSGGVCVECHEPDSKGMKAAMRMRVSIDSLTAIIDSAATLVNLARTIGMDAEEAEYQLRQASDELVKSRALVHAFAPDRVTEVTEQGAEFARQAAGGGADLLEQFTFRRRGFILSVIIILALSALLTLKIRTLPPSAE